MVHNFISDRELGPVDRGSEEITVEIWNGIVAVYENAIETNILSGNFPQGCPDGQGISGCDRNRLENAIKAEIPKLTIPIETSRITRYQDEANVLPEKYAMLDLIEFLYKNLKDPVAVGRYHDYFNHFHFSFHDTGQSKYEFRGKINSIFSRNGVVFYLDDQGEIKRAVPESFKNIISNIRFSTRDHRLNELLEISYAKFILPRIESRIESLEKIWDAFERLKTYYEENKKASANTLISTVSKNNTLFSSYIESEFQALTKIGNEFQIRHFERNKVELQSNLHVDYLFYRMSSLIHLCIESIKFEEI